MDNRHIFTNPAPNVRRVREFIDEFQAMIKRNNETVIRFDDFLIEYRPEMILYIENAFDRCDDGVNHLKSIFFNHLRGTDMTPHFLYREDTIQVFYRDFARRRGLI